MSFTEDTYEQAIIELFQRMGYTHIYAPDMGREDFTNPLLEDELFESLVRINRGLPVEAIREAMGKLRNFEEGSLEQKNRTFTGYLQDGVEVKYFAKGEERSALVYLIDYRKAENNRFYIVNQYTYIEKGNNRRPDVILFVNGLPLVVMELKSPSQEEAGVEKAYNQLRNYQKDIPSLFIYNAICVVSDLSTSRAGTITAGLDRFMEWKSKDGEAESGLLSLDTFYEGMFRKERLLDLLKNFICYSWDPLKPSKILAGYHQYFAVRKAVVRAVEAAKTDGRGGVFWHTQGSGKSFSMVFYAHLLQELLQSPTLVVMTDRVDLDDQLYDQFCKCSDFLRQTPLQATSKENLKELLAGREANGILFTTMFKFEKGEEPLSTRRNIVIMADEAHRGQYGFEEKVILSKNPEGGESARISVGNARLIREALPGATYVGFTGTPIAIKDRNTREVFGPYIDIYDMTQAVADGATCPVYYESRVIHLKLDEESLRLIDATYDALAEEADPATIEKSKKMLGQMESVLGAEATIQSLCEDILAHYEGTREKLLTGKAVIVAYSRPIAMKIYRKLLALRPGWQEKVAVVMTGSNSDPEDWKEIVGNKAHKEELARRFKDDEDPLKIAIVVDMWLTGFDLPSLATMYVYKPMRGYNLMQAIARVNRVFRDKAGGLVVDYVGIASALKEAMREYTARDRQKYGDMDIAKTAYPKFQEKLQVCRDLFHGYDFSAFFLDSQGESASPYEMARAITGGVNFLLAAGEGERRELFLKEALLLHQAYTLSASMAAAEEHRLASYFEAVRATTSKIVMGGAGGKPLSLKEINEEISELLKASVQSEGVINLFESSKLGERFSLFEPDVLAEIAKMKEKNLVAELLRRLMAEQIAIYRRTNLVKATVFSEKITLLMNTYYNGLITNEEVIQEILKTAEEIARLRREGEALGLSEEELAFYDALTRPENIKDFYKNDELLELTRVLTETLRKSRTIDWQRKETARAKMRTIVKRLLKQYHYPPEKYEDAIDTVISQCELWTDQGEANKIAY